MMEMTIADLDLGVSSSGILDKHIDSGASSLKRRVATRKIPFEKYSKRQNVSQLPRVLPSQLKEKAVSNQEEQEKELVSVYCHESRLKLSRKRANKLQFVEGTKTFDGLEEHKQSFDEIIHQFFVLGKQFSAVDVIRLFGMDQDLISKVGDLMQCLCKRIIAIRGPNEDAGVPVLIQGGGRGMKVTPFHLPYLNSLLKVVREAANVASLGFSINDKKKPQPEPIVNL